MMNTDQKLRIILRSVLRAAEAVPSRPWEKGFEDRRMALEEACVEARGVLRVIDNEGLPSEGNQIDTCSVDPSDLLCTPMLPDSDLTRTTSEPKE